jgi:hypothetical protein
LENLVREIGGPRFAAEVCKIFLDPYWQARLYPHIQAVKILRNHPTGHEASQLLTQYFLRQLGAVMPAVSYPDGRTQRVADEREKAHRSALPFGALPPHTQNAHDDRMDLILNVPAALQGMGKDAAEEEFPWGRTVGDMWVEVGRSAGEKARTPIRKTEGETSWGDMAMVRATFRWQDTETLSDKDRARLQHQRAETEEEIRTCRRQKARNYLRLLEILYEDGSLTQNKETADRAGVSLRTLQTFLAEGRRRGWFAT